MIHSDTICDRKTGTRIDSAWTSFIFVCPICFQEKRYKTPEIGERIVCDGENFKLHIINPKIKEVIDKDLERRKMIFRRLTMRNTFVTEDDVSLEDLLELEANGIIEKKTVYTLKNG